MDNVSILVLLDYPLRQRYPLKAGRGQPVSILVLLDYPLRHLVHAQLLHGRVGVSILVLLDYPLRRGMGL